MIYHTMFFDVPYHRNSRTAVGGIQDFETPICLVFIREDNISTNVYKNCVDYTMEQTNMFIYMI